MNRVLHFGRPFAEHIAPIVSSRALDVLIASVAFLAALPLLAIMALLIRLDSKGPAIFRQQRVGRDGKAFTIYKLRTMHVNTSEQPTHLTSPSATTRVGRILRLTKLDELPQLFNVIKGEMALVGPRPGLLTQVSLLEGRRAFGILRSRPGITGLAQAVGVDMSNEPRLLALDARYVARRSMMLDLRIILATILGAWLLPRDARA